MSVALRPMSTAADIDVHRRVLPVLTRKKKWPVGQPSVFRKSKFLKAVDVGPFYLVSMSGEVKYPTQSQVVNV